jgi:hypothetical protein
MAPAPKEVVITGIDISFMGAVGLMVKWSLDSFPPNGASVGAL